MTGYAWLDHRRKYINRRARKGAGGVGMFVSHNTLAEYEVIIFDKSYVDILAVQFIHRVTEMSILVVTGYLPPDNSPWGGNADDCFNHMLSIISKDDSDIVYINGDWNARIGNNPDYIEGIDEISKRHNLDSTTNTHGNALLDFLKESKNYILNGRITPILDDYTSVSTKGKAVVDYGVMPVDCIDVCTMCQVHVTAEVINNVTGPGGGCV